MGETRSIAVSARANPGSKSSEGRRGRVAQARAVPALDRLRFERWEEGLAAQVLHVGPYADEAPSIARLHEGIAAAGYRPRGRHHEIYLGDPRRSAPDTRISRPPQRLAGWMRRLVFQS